MADFNGTAKEARAEIAEIIRKGGSHLDFNKKYDNITIDGRPTKGVRSEGINQKTGQTKIKIEYTDTLEGTTSRRKTALDAQTGNKKSTFPTQTKARNLLRQHGSNVPQGTKLRIHHQQVPSILQTYYELGPNFNEADRAELIRFQSEDLGRPPGNVEANAALLDEWTHDQAYHNRDRSHDGIKPQQSNPKKTPTGNPNVRNFEVPKSATLNQRKAALRVFYQDGPGAAMEQQLYTARMASQNPNHPEVQRNFLTEFEVGPEKGQVTPPPDMDPTRTQASSDIKTKRIQPNINKARALRIARFAAAGPLSLGLGAASLGLSAQAAWEDPTAHNIEDAAWDTANFTADALSLVPILALPLEGAQKLLSMGHQARIATRGLETLYPTKTQGKVDRFIQGYESEEEISPNLERELYEAGGGNAAMTKYGWTIEQTMLQGRKNLELQYLENMKIE